MFWQFFRKKKQVNEVSPATAVIIEKTNFKQVDPYTEQSLSPEEERVVSLIATSVLAGNQPKSKFKILSIKKENPEYKRVSLIATSLAAGEKANTKFKIMQISRKVGKTNA